MPQSGAAKGRHGCGVAPGAHRCRHRDVRFELHHVFHNPDDRRHAACTWRNTYRYRTASRGSASTACGQSGVLAVYAGSHRHGDAGGARACRFIRLCDRRGFRLAWIFGEKAARREALLHRARNGHDGRARHRFRRPGCRQDDVLVGGGQWRTRAATHSACSAPHEQSTRDGRARQLSRLARTWMDHVRTHDCGDHRHAGELKMPEEKDARPVAGMAVPVRQPSRSFFTSR